jgi:Translation-initiation factor 2
MFCASSLLLGVLAAGGCHVALCQRQSALDDQQRWDLSVGNAVLLLPLQGAKKFAVILAFDVPVTREARDLAESMGVRIFTADIIYHLFDQFTAYLKQARAASADRRAVFVSDAATCWSAAAAQLYILP